ncbi:MAG: Hint domain-containing protein [Pseudomonadota bacterium]|nr:Hint domain-containing protein [Pseudomonadota bacterium]
MSVTSSLLYILDTQNDPTIDSFLVTNGSTVSSPNDLTPGGSTIGSNFFESLVVDSVDAVYFVTVPTGAGATASTAVYEETLGAPASFATPKFTYQDGQGDFIASMALDAPDHIMYFTAGGGGLFEENFGSSFANTPTQTNLATFGVGVSQMVFDQADHTIYALGVATSNVAATTGNGGIIFTANGGVKQTNIVTNDILYKVSGVTKNATSGSLTQTATPFPYAADGVTSAVALDTATDTLYIATNSVQTGGVFGLYAEALSGPNAGQLTTVFQETQAHGVVEPSYLTVDSATGQYYFSSATDDGIYTGSVNSHNAPTLLTATSAPVKGLFIDNAPNATGAAVNAIDGNTGKTTGTVTTADTVKINVTFSQNVFVSGTPSLTLNDGGAATYSSGSGSSTLTFLYTPAAGQNTTGLASTGVSGGSIADSAGTPAVLTSATQTFTGLNVETTGPSLSVTGVTGDVIQGAATATTLLQTDSISDAFGPGSIHSATITIANAQFGDSLSIPGVSSGTLDGGKVSVSGLGTSTLTLTGDDTVAEYQTLLNSVTYQDLGVDMTTVGHPTRTVDWTVDDGVLPSNLATTSVTIERMPSVQAGATATFISAGPPATLDPSLTVTDLDNSIVSAIVRIASGFVSGDTLNFTNSGTITGTQVGDELILSGAATAADYQAALDSVSYSFTPANGDPTVHGTDTTRTIAWGVYDGLLNSNFATSTLDLTPCYVTGTLILTEHGEKTVESLVIGDVVLTAGGARRPIKWIGTRGYSARFARNNADAHPVCFKAGSLADNVPTRDLWVSPQHAMYLDGWLIPANRLVNGVTVSQPLPRDDVRYFHVELETHDILIANSAASESFLDDDSRGMFHNAASYEALYAHERARPSAYCAPRVESGEALEQVRRRLAARAGLSVAREIELGALGGEIERLDAHGVEGWARSAAFPSAPVCLEARLDGESLGYAYAQARRPDGHHGFALRFARSLDPNQVARVEIVRALDGAPLRAKGLQAA